MKINRPKHHERHESKISPEAENFLEMIDTWILFCQARIKQFLELSHSEPRGVGT